MTDDLERRLREAFEAKTSQITPSMIDLQREREVAAELASGSASHHRWRAAAGGLAAAAAVAAAVGVGVVVSDQQPTRRPAVAASSPHPVTSSAGPRATPPPTSQPKQSMHGEPSAPASTESVAPTLPSTPAAKVGAGESALPRHAPTVSSEPTPSKADGNYYLRGDLRTAAGVGYLPLPASIPTYIESETGRTTILRTDDCAGIAAYWKRVMPALGWSQDSDLKWIAPTGNAWAFLSTASGGGTIQISAGP